MNKGALNKKRILIGLGAVFALLILTVGLSQITKEGEKPSDNPENGSGNTDQKTEFSYYALPEEIFLISGEYLNEQSFRVYQHRFDLETSDESQEFLLTTEVRNDVRYGPVFDVSDNLENISWSNSEKFKLLQSSRKRELTLRQNVTDLAKIQFFPGGDKLLVSSRDERGEYLEVYKDFSVESEIEIVDYKNPSKVFFNNSGNILGLTIGCDINNESNGIYLSQSAGFGGIYKEPLSVLRNECEEIGLSTITENGVIVFEKKEGSTIEISKIKQNGSEFEVLFQLEEDQTLESLDSSKITEGFYFLTSENNGAKIKYFSEEDGEENLVDIDSILKIETPLKVIENSRSKGEYFYIIYENLENEFTLLIGNRKGEVEAFSLGKKESFSKKYYFEAYHIPLTLSYNSFEIYSPKELSTVKSPLNISGRIERKAGDQTITVQLETKNEIFEQSLDISSSFEFAEFENFSTNIEYEAESGESMRLRFLDEGGKIIKTLSLRNLKKDVQIINNETLKNIIGGKTIIIKKEVDLDGNGTSEFLTVSDSGSFGGVRELSLNLIAYNFTEEIWESVFDYTNQGSELFYGPENDPVNYPYIIEYSDGEKAFLYQIKKDEGGDTYTDYFIWKYNGSFVDKVMEGKNLLNSGADIPTDQDYLLEAADEYAIKWNAILSKFKVTDEPGKPSWNRTKVYVWKNGSYELQEEILSNSVGEVIEDPRLINGD